MGVMESWKFWGVLLRIGFGVLVVTWPVSGLRPLRQRRPWGEEVCVEFLPFSCFFAFCTVQNVVGYEFFVMCCCFDCDS